MISYIFALLLVQYILISHGDGFNDFKLGVQLCDGSAGENTGDKQYTDFASNGGGWSLWAGDSNYYDPDGVRIGLVGRDNQAQCNGFHLENTDIRFKIQLTDHASDTSGNSEKEGAVQRTPWASQGGGWSDWAGDSNWYDFDAVRVKIETRAFNGLVLDNIRAGVRVSDKGTNHEQKGDPKYTEWLDQESDGKDWSPWASDTNWYDPDSIKIYLGVRATICQDVGGGDVQPIYNNPIDYPDNNNPYGIYINNNMMMNLLGILSVISVILSSVVCFQCRNGVQTAKYQSVAMNSMTDDERISIKQ